MSSTSDHLNQDGLKKLAARENLTFLGLTLPYLLMVAFLIVILALIMVVVVIMGFNED